VGIPQTKTTALPPKAREELHFRATPTPRARFDYLDFASLPAVKGANCHDGGNSKKKRGLSNPNIHRLAVRPLAKKSPEL
jgi:hypothetical protein